MTRKIWLRILTFANVAVLFSCEPTAPLSSGSEFFPLEQGLFWEYDVTEQVYTVSAAPTQRTYQLRERVGDAVTTQNSNSPSFRLERYSRPNERGNWRLDSVWTVRRSPTEAVRTENNQPLVKMIFPVQEGSRWVANAARGINYRYRSAFRPLETYPQTVSVVERDDSTAINLYRKREVYAAAVGLFYKENAALEYCQSSPSCIGKGQIEFGIRQIFRLKKYGKEE